MTGPNERLATPPVPVIEAENALHAALLAVAENGEGSAFGCLVRVAKFV